MMRWITLSLGFLCLALVTGCPYSSEVPLAEPGASALDGRLMGQWIGVDSEGDSVQIAWLPFNRSESYAEVREKSGAVTRYRVFAFDVGGERLLHINELAEVGTAPEYSFVRYEFSGDSRLALRFVGDKIVPKEMAGDPRALSAFLEAHLDDPALDDDESTLALYRSE